MATLWPPPFGSLVPGAPSHPAPPCPPRLPRPCKGWLTLGRKERVGRVGSCWAFWVPQGWKSLKHSLQKVARHSVQPLVASSGGGLHSWHKMAPPTLTLWRYRSTTRSRVRFRKSPAKPRSPSSTSPWQAGHGNMIAWGCRAPRFRPGYVPKPGRREVENYSWLRVGGVCSIKELIFIVPELSPWQSLDGQYPLKNRQVSLARDGPLPFS